MGQREGALHLLGGGADRKSWLCLLHFPQGSLFYLPFFPIVVLTSTVVLDLGDIVVLVIFSTGYWLSGVLVVVDSAAVRFPPFLDCDLGFFVPRFQWIPLQFLKTSVWR